MYSAKLEKSQMDINREILTVLADPDYQRKSNAKSDATSNIASLSTIDTLDPSSAEQNLSAPLTPSASLTAKRQSTRRKTMNIVAAMVPNIRRDTRRKTWHLGARVSCTER